jgi:hypothetical protein
MYMATLGYTTKLELDPGTGTFAELLNCISITLPKSNVNMVDSTSLTSANRTRTYVPGLIDAGSFDFEVQYAKATLTALKAVEGIASVGSTPLPVKWRITLPDEDGAGAITAVVFTFPGTLVSLEGDAKVEDILVLKCGVKVTGAVTIA